MPMRVAGLVSAKEGFLDEIEAAARDSESSPAPLFAWPALDGLRQRLGDASRAAAEACAAGGLEPADLASPSRRAFQLVSYLADRRNLEEHLETLRRLVRLSRADGRGLIRLDHTGSLYRIERRAEAVRLVASEGFVGAPEPVLLGLARLAIPYARKRQPRRDVRDYAESPGFAEMLRRVEASGGAYRSRPAGVVFDLNELFQVVNRGYFGGRLDPPRLLWSERVPSVEFGHYEPATDTVRLSRRLDAEEVPSFVLEHVMHHELLHRFLGAEVGAGRRRYHSARFRREERRFARYREAEAFLRRLARHRGTPR